MPIVRRQRRLLFGCLLAVVWAIALGGLWGISGTSWTRVSVAGPGGVRETRFGVVPYLTVRSQDITAAGVRGPDWQRAWSVHPGGLAVAIPATVLIALACGLGHRRLVDRHRLIGCCDECGYSLVGLRSSVCPECGSRVTRTVSPGRVRRPARRPLLALAVGWAMGVTILWLGGGHTTIRGLPGVAQRSIRQRGIPTWIVIETNEATDGARTSTTDLRPGGLAVVIALTLTLSGLVGWAYLRQRRRRSTGPCPACGYLRSSDDRSDRPCPVCGTSPTAR